MFCGDKADSDKCVSNGQDMDDYGHNIPYGIKYLKGHFLERKHHSATYQLFTLSKMATYFYHESIVYPYVNISAEKKGFVLKNSDYADILHFIEHTQFSHL